MMMINKAQMGFLGNGIDREQLIPLGGIWTLLFSMTSRELGDLDRSCLRCVIGGSPEQAKAPGLLEQKTISNLGRYQEVKSRLKF